MHKIDSRCIDCGREVENTKARLVFAGLTLVGFVVFVIGAYFLITTILDRSSTVSTIENVPKEFRAVGPGYTD